MLLLLLPARERLLRTGALLYLATLVVSYVVRSPMGSNAVRLGALLAPALLIGAVSIPDARRALGAARAPDGRRRRWRRARGHRANGPPRARRGHGGDRAVAGQRSARPVGAVGRRPVDAPVLLPAGDALPTARQDGTPMRIEVAFTSSHWDATVLGRQFDLARGWERQLDLRYNQLFYDGTLTAATYQRWLLATGVRFVVLSDAPLDPSSVAEAALIRRGLPYLHEVFASAHWRVFAVAGAQPLATGRHA